MRAMRESPFPTQLRRQSGVTLIELMIAVVVVSLLAMVALPSYQDSVRKSRRGEAFVAISTVQLAQERARGSFPTYCPNLASAPTASVCGLNTNATTANGRYALEVSGPDASGYTLIATAQGDQVGDTRCAKLGVKMSNGAMQRGSGSTSIDWTLADPDVNRCWAK
jgi:type IV pilus assembly protein PilE